MSQGGGGAANFYFFGNSPRPTRAKYIHSTFLGIIVSEYVGERIYFCKS